MQMTSVCNLFELIPIQRMEFAVCCKCMWVCGCVSWQAPGCFNGWTRQFDCPVGVHLQALRRGLLACAVIWTLCNAWWDACVATAANKCMLTMWQIPDVGDLCQVCLQEEARQVARFIPCPSDPDSNCRPCS